MAVSLPFLNRADAAQSLAARLQRYRGHHAVVLAIPRGAVPMGRVLARALDADLDIVLVRKLGAPDQPELAVGAIDETGWVFVTEFAERCGASEAYLQREILRQREVLAERSKLFRGNRPPIELTDRVAIVVDDGMATGATMQAALHAIRARRPARLICAVPVASNEAVQLVRPACDEVVCLAIPPWFGSVGHYYLDFRQVEDEEVVACLKAARMDLRAVNG